MQPSLGLRHLHVLQILLNSLTDKKPLKRRKINSAEGSLCLWFMREIVEATAWQRGVAKREWIPAICYTYSTFFQKAQCNYDISHTHVFSKCFQQLSTANVKSFLMRIYVDIYCAWKSLLLGYSKDAWAEKRVIAITSLSWTLASNDGRLLA